mmetsp:Transcript_128012/g.356241  ORF Transcript_128012/g.356241 Transcript_128012/m.356241 type:complete len:222 (+) Transcript_128012:76-741(+)
MAGRASLAAAASARARRRCRARAWAGQGGGAAGTFAVAAASGQVLASTPGRRLPIGSKGCGHSGGVPRGSAPAQSPSSRARLWPAAARSRKCPLVAGGPGWSACSGRFGEVLQDPQRGARRGWRRDHHGAAVRGGGPGAAGPRGRQVHPGRVGVRSAAGECCHAARQPEGRPHVPGGQGLEGHGGARDRDAGAQPADGHDPGIQDRIQHTARRGNLKDERN